MVAETDGALSCEILYHAASEVSDTLTFEKVLEKLSERPILGEHGNYFFLLDGHSDSPAVSSSK